MTITEATTEQDQRAAAITGLHELADFLEQHPDVPLPHASIHSAHPDRARVLAAWVDGLDTLDIRQGIVGPQFDRRVFRTFTGFEVALNVNVDALGEVREVPSTATELVPFTLDEIRARAVTA